jgi:glycosyltransferase involved in cell wall biosynthesis
LAFGAEDVQNPRKGFHSLLQALRMMPEDQPVECIVFGRGELPTDRSGLPVLHEMGFIDGPEHQSAIYSAADVFVLPSLEDNAPQTGLEAMACGTPVVAYESGGIPEFVMPGQTGLLAPVGNVAALARQIGDLASHDRLRQRLAAGARRLIESEYDVRKQVRKYIDLYATLVANAKSATRRAA